MMKKKKKLEKSLEKKEGMNKMNINHNFYEITEKEFYDNIDYYKDKVYLYHFIIFVYEDKYVKVDTIDELNKINTSGLISKYYVEKIHFFNECDYEEFEYGEPYYIYNLGYFYIGGFVKDKLLDKEYALNLFDNYNQNFSKMKFDFNDQEFLNKNKKLI